MNFTNAVRNTDTSRHKFSGDYLSRKRPSIDPDALKIFAARLDRALDELGRFDHGLQVATDGLLAEEANASDCLVSRIEPELHKAVAQLVEALRSARQQAKESI